MNLLAWNLLLALFWAAVSNDFSLFTLFVGYMYGFLVLRLLLPRLPKSRYFSKTRKLLFFGVFYIRELIVANLKVAHDVLTPQFKMKPGIVALPLDCKTDFEITLFANLLSLTPGSLSIDLSQDRTELYVHGMFIEDGDVEGFKKAIKESLERRVLELLR